MPPHDPPYWDLSAYRNVPIFTDPEHRQGPAVRFHDAARKSVTFIGGMRPDGAFEPYGTAFFYGDPIPGQQHCIGYLVTAKHVLDEIRNSKMIPVATINNKSGNAELVRFSMETWSFHPTKPLTDVAITGCTLSADMFDLPFIDGGTCILTDEYITANNIGCGDEVHICGLLTRHFGVTRNVPIVRTGNIAAMPEEPVDLGTYGKHYVYLIEGRSIGGLSGSPVFLTPPPFRIIDDGIRQTTGQRVEYLLGINIGLFEVMAHADRIPDTPLDRREAFLETMSAGIAVVVPIQRVVEILQGEEFVKTNTEAAKRLTRETNGFVPISAHKPHAQKAEKVASESDNPDHKEDFTRLLGAAAKTHKSDD